MGMRSLGLCILVGLLLQCRVATGAITDSNVTQANYVKAPNNATGMAWFPDGSNRLLVTLKGGQVRMIKDGALLTTPFATITPVHTNSECGLIGLAFDPNFIVNKYVYFFVTISASEQQVVRYTASGDVGTDKTTILSGLPTRGQNHDGGAVGFGPDGMLYFAIGDLGNGTGVDNDLTTLAAKVGRAYPNGSIPSDNPFVDGAGGNNDYIWARGFRNPFTFTFQPSTGKLWTNVVGSRWEQVFVVDRGTHGGWNDRENNQPNGYLVPPIAYRTNATNTAAIAQNGAVRQGGVVTITTTGPHLVRKGGRVGISGVTNTSFDLAEAVVTSVPSATTLTYSQPGSDAQSGGGAAATPNMGGCITGGTFYEGTQFPAPYRGNFFFGDYNSYRLYRAILAQDNTVAQVDDWGNSLGAIIDMETGPDGALYIMNYSGQIYRASYNRSDLGIIVSRTNVRMAEGGQAAFNVSLTRAPSADLTVNVSRTSGDSDVGISTGGTLTFTTTNWSTPQVVTLAAADDADSVDDSSTVSLQANGVTTETVEVRVTDNDVASLIVSTPTLNVTEGESGSFTVSLSTAPAAPVTVNMTLDGDGDIKITSPVTRSLSFDGTNFATPQEVTVLAESDPDTNEDKARITVSAQGYMSRSVEVTAKDTTTAPPNIVSTPVTRAAVGALYSYDVEATGGPTPTFALATSPEGMTINATSGLITWTPGAVGSYGVTVRATNGVQPDATQAFTLDVVVDAAPTCELTRPASGDVVSGRNADFYGEAADDVGISKVEFYVDDNLIYTDTQGDGHYHAGGNHGQWDTTTIPNGPHKVRMTAYDTLGQVCSKEVSVTVSNDGDRDASTGPRDAGRGNQIRGSSGCGCRAAGSQVPGGEGGTLLLLAALLLVRRRAW
ncbi:MAG: PQQ-dependent sugar dehydrogenase [Deltaproteobacteria bacterium]|nr:PQQ-dependent sugar dehydrogenase [Deltaproteobacteria bacterium]